MNLTTLTILTLAVLIGLSSPRAAAETVEARCRADWWVETPGFNASFEGLTARPTVPLPASWSKNWSAGLPDPATTPELTVVVRDAASDVVAGALGVGFALGGPPGASYGAKGDALERALWWRPDADLAPGTYEIGLAVAVPPRNSDNAQCYFQEFTATLGFTVVAEPPPAPVVTAKATLTRIYSDSLVYQAGALCTTNPNTTACANEATACCAWSEPPMVGFATEVEVSGLGVAKSFAHALFIERDPLKSPTAYDHELLAPVADQSPLSRQSNYRPAPFERPFPNGFFCVDATLRDLTTAVDVASVQECAFASRLEAAQLAPPACDPVACSAAVAAAPPDTGPEPPPDAGPEPDPAEPTPDGAAPDAESSDADAQPFDASPAGGKQAPGCGATPSSGAVPPLLGLLLAWALVRRRESPPAALAARGHDQP
jgi:uncharacterized protein (TIGR03382 family)